MQCLPTPRLRKLWVAALLLPATVLLVGSTIARAAEPAWKAGTARAVITPKSPMWMSGYAARNKPSQGVVHDLWAKALVIQDGQAQRALLITLDVCGIGRDLSNRVRDAIGTRLGLGRERIVIACSHTHSGPVVGNNLLAMYNLDAQQVELVNRYAQSLEQTLLSISEEATKRLADARLSYGNGRCDFAVNRRANKEADVPALRQRMELKGPVDHDVPVLRVDRADGSLLAAVFGYACHCTVLDGYEFCGDYAGFAQIDLESSHAGAQAMFVAGCGGDQNPIPRRSLVLACRYGKELAARCGEVLGGPLRALAGPLGCTYEEIALEFGPLPSREQIEGDGKSSNFFTASRAQALSRDHQAARFARKDLSLPGAGLAAWRAELDFSGWGGGCGLLAADQAKPGIVAHLGFGVLQRRDGVYSVETSPRGRRI